MLKLREKKQELVRNFNRSAIYDAAVGLFKEYGFDGFTMQQVATKSGMAIGTLYNYFTNKEQIIRYVGDSLFENFHNSSTEATKQGSAIEKIEAFSKCFLEFGIENRALIKLFEHAQIADDRKRKLQMIVELLQDIIKIGTAKHEFIKVDPKKSALYVLSLLFGYNNHIADIQDIDPEKDAKGIVAFMKPYFIGSK
jgi:AcrR family transcriptional regulator